MFVQNATAAATTTASTDRPTTPAPVSVTIVGSMQRAVGCAHDWHLPCPATRLSYDATADVWYGSIAIPAAPTPFAYKVALNDRWDENYGAHATRDGADIPLRVDRDTIVTFVYDHKTHWVTDTTNDPIVTVVGDFQTALGCSQDWQPHCLRTWLQDPHGTGTYGMSTTALPAGRYAAKVVINASWQENYGANGASHGANIAFTVPQDGTAVSFRYDPQSHVLTINVAGVPNGDLTTARAHWIAADTIAWAVPHAADHTFTLHADPSGGLTRITTGVQGGQRIPLAYDPAGLSTDQIARFPHIAGYAALKIDALDRSQLRALVQGQIAVSVTDRTGQLVDATALQIPGMLDDLVAYRGELGVAWGYTASRNVSRRVPTLRVWAPTARSVRLHLFADADPATTSIVHAMRRDAQTGVWSITGTRDWINTFYLYEVEVFVPRTGRIERNLVTDPYSISLATNSTRSQIVDLDDPQLKPDGWDQLTKPPLDAPEDIVIYELHVRDFSISDHTVPEPLRGTFRAFTVTSTNGMRHLHALAQAGLTHIHLLPVFDIATIEEDRTRRREPDPTLLAKAAPDGQEQQRIVGATRVQDGFNWGYDPYHFTTPEGSYATDPNGAARIREFREMVQALNAIGLRVVMDVVYNHTHASGQHASAVLDRIVPGYYHRLNANGAVEQSTCCENTATEHAMMEKLMLDSLRTWATAYKIDGFRFDLMGHHMRSNMLNVRTMLNSLSLARDVVDGNAIYLYGEGWNFGEVADNRRGINATQANMAGTGIGTFNDRLRDAVRGGGPHSGLQEQGFASGLFCDPNSTEQGLPNAQHARLLLLLMDQIRVGLAGNLRAYTLTDRTGATVRGDQVPYNGSPTAYADDPQDVINYIEAHDNETWFDALQLKASASANIADRVRMHNLGNSIVMLAQGIPFFHAGQDLLRSKSLDRNSYNSGDWFNRIDWSYETNNFAVGLPVADNHIFWPIMRPLLANPALRPTRDHILAAAAHFRELLLIRKSSPLFRLRTGDAVQRCVRFLNTGPDQIPGLIVMQLVDDAPHTDDHARPTDQIVVLFNATPHSQVYRADPLAGSALVLHPAQCQSHDPVVRAATFDSATGTFDVPARTTAVWITAGPGYQR